MAKLKYTDIEWVSHVVLLPIILFIGFFGQILNLLTLHQRHLKSATFLYLKAVGFAEFFSVLALIPFVLRHAFDDETHHSRWPCWILFYGAHIEIPLANAFVAANTLCIVGLTVERYLSICHPLWALKANGTPNRTRLVIAFLYILAFALFIPAAFQKKLEYSPINETALNMTSHMDFEYDSRPCTDWIIARNHVLHGQKWFKIYLLLREIFVRIGPTLILIILNVAIFYGVKRTSRKRKRLISTKRLSAQRLSNLKKPAFIKRSRNSNEAKSGSLFETDAGQSASQSIEETPLMNDEHSSVPPALKQALNYNESSTLVVRYRGTKRHKNEQERQKRIYVLLVITVLTFLICTIPASVLSLLVTDHHTNEHTMAFQVFRAAANLLEAVSYSINFYIYCLCSEDYRKLFLKLLEKVFRCLSWIFASVRME